MVTFIIPVKGLDSAKTRLQVTGIRNDQLVLAMLQDTLRAALDADRGPVVVVSPDTDVIEASLASGARAMNHSGDINEAISAALVPGICAGLLADLPALRAQDLLDALADRREGFVPDLAGTGTTLAFSDRLQPRFGRDSAALHAAQGLPRIDMSGTGLALDVDTAADLAAAERIGVGSHTAALLTSG